MAAAAARVQAIGHIVGEIYKNNTGAQLLHVPYKGGTSIAALVQGESDFTEIGRAHV